MKGDEFLRACAGRAPFSKMHPEMMAFFKAYLAHEKVIRFGDRYVLNTHFPPYPGPAFDTLADNFNEVGGAGRRRLFSVTLAVTNRCPYACWHCYNAHRSQEDMPLESLARIVTQLQSLGAAVVTLSGGEPLLRADLAEIVRCFDERTALVLNTTGRGLTPQRASELRAAGLFAVGVSVDSEVEEEHDRMRGCAGALRTALEALESASAGGLYPYIVSVATRRFLEPQRFWSFLRFARAAGACEVHLLEPSATGRLAGNTGVTLDAAERRRILRYQREVAEDEQLPILSTFTYLESAEAFGCGAGLTHLYIDGSGEVCPCNLVPLSFGNATRVPIEQVLDAMGRHFRKPRPGCVARVLCPEIQGGRLPLGPEAAAELCRRHLPSRHGLPGFFRIRARAAGEVGQEALQQAYDGIHRFYDEFWVKEAGRPVQDLIERVPLRGGERIFEAGCGTGYATVRLAARLDCGENLVAADISEGMLTEARERARLQGLGGIRFVRGDALELLDGAGPLDVVFSSWVLGYIPLAPFFAAAGRSLGTGGRLAFVVHREDSPREPLEIFGELVLEDPTVLTKRVAFDFPANIAAVRQKLAAAGFEAEHLAEGAVEFRYETAAEVLRHLQRSGAGTAYYEAVDPERRAPLEQRFIEKLTRRNAGKTGYSVRHDYIACVARKGSTPNPPVAHLVAEPDRPNPNDQCHAG